MIKISLHAPPAKYYSRVRKPGLKYLRHKPHPTASEFRRHAYWSEIHDDLYQDYKGICAYCASWTPRTPSKRLDHTSVDHFLPKSLNPYLAYEWDNFRLCRSRLNANKADQLTVIDPLYVTNGWFALDFATFLIIANDSIPTYIQFHVDESISTLGLNVDDYVNERISIVKQYCLDTMSLTDLRSLYPFIAAEMVRVDFDNTLKNQMRDFFLMRI